MHRRPHYLRVAFSLACGIVAVLLLALVIAYVVDATDAMSFFKAKILIRW
jgi:hypothetical protein